MFEKNRNEVIAIIPARSGSKGIKDKNIADVCGFPLIAYSIMAARMCIEIDRVIVSTDSENYADTARRYGAEVPFLRPEEISGSTAQDIEYLCHALRYLGETEGKVPEYLVLLRPTTPIRDVKLIEQAIEVIKENEAASAVVSVHDALECPYKWMKIGKEGYLESPFQEMKPDDVNLPRQSFSKLFIPDGYVDVLRAETILEGKCVYGDKALPFYGYQEVVDIDSIEDMEKVIRSDIYDSEIYKELCRQKSVGVSRDNLNVTIEKKAKVLPVHMNQEQSIETEQLLIKCNRR